MSHRDKNIEHKDEGLVALIYARVSTVSQDSESQIHRCRQFAEQKGYKIGEIFPDKFTGGGDFWNRPQMRRMLDHIDTYPSVKFVVIFDDLKRFARDTEFHIRLRKEFRSRGIRIECLNFNFEDSPEGEFVETMFAAQGQLERQQNRRQVIQKMKARLERGLWCFDFPAGMKYINDPIHGKLLAPDELKAGVIREALEGFASNKLLNQTDVQAFLETREFFHRKKHKSVYLEQVKRILTQILYTGYIEYKPWGIGRKKGHHQGIISLQTYEKIQDKLNGTSKAAVRKDLHLDFPARGFILCSVCGKPFTASWTTKRKGYRRAYYRCNKSGCIEKNKSISKDDLEKEIGKVLKKARAKEEVFILGKEILFDIWNERKVDSGQFEEQIKKEINKTEAEIATYLERINKATSELVISEYEKKIDELSNKKLLLDEKINTQSKPDGVSFETALSEVFRYIKSPYDIWTDGTFEEKRLILRMVFLKHPSYNKKTGVETASFSVPVTLFQYSGGAESQLVEMGGIEPPCIDI